MTNIKTVKKGPSRQLIVQQLRRQHVDRQLFTLDYLNQAMSYIIYNNQSLQTYLEIDTNILDRVITEDVKKVGLHIVQRIKSMKQTCDQNIFVKDLQESGDFVNYDLPKSYQRDLSFIQSELRQQVQTQLATKRLKKRFPNIGTRMTSHEINKLNNKLKEQILSSVISGWQMVPEPVQNNLEKNTLYRQLFNIQEVMRYQNEERPTIQNIPTETGISNKIKIAQKPQAKNQNADLQKTKKIARGPRKHQVSNQEPEQYVPKISKKSKIDQNPLIIPKPVLTNPQILPPKAKKQPNLQPTPVLLGQMAEIDKKSTKYSNNVNNQEIAKSAGVESQGGQSKKEKVSDQQNIVSNVSAPQQKVKRKYTKAPKEGKVDQTKKTKTSSKTEKEHKEKREYHRRQKKSEEQQPKKKREKKLQTSQSKKPDPEANFGEHAVATATLAKDNQPLQELSLVSVAIQTSEKQDQSDKKNEVKQQKQNEQVAFSMNSEKDRINLFQSIRIEELKQEDKVPRNPGQSMIGHSSILGENSSFHFNSSRRQSISIRQENVLQSSLSVSNPFYPDNPHPNPQQQAHNAQRDQIEEEKELDISYFLA